MKQIAFEYLTKKPALGYAQALASRMLDIKDEAEMEDILWRPYAYERWNPEEIQKRLDLLTPHNCYVIF